MHPEIPLQGSGAAAELGQGRGGVGGLWCSREADQGPGAGGGVGLQVGAARGRVQSHPFLPAHPRLPPYLHLEPWGARPAVPPAPCRENLGDPQRNSGRRGSIPPVPSPSRPSVDAAPDLGPSRACSAARSVPSCCLWHRSSSRCRACTEGPLKLLPARSESPAHGRPSPQDFFFPWLPAALTVSCTGTNRPDARAQHQLTSLP